MEPETDGHRSDDNPAAIQRSWAIEGYWEDELMQYAAGLKPDDAANDPWQEMDRPLTTSDF